MKTLIQCGGCMLQARTTTTAEERDNGALTCPRCESTDWDMIPDPKANEFSGYQQFHAEETQEEFGSFEVFYNDDTGELYAGDVPFVENEPLPEGWYWAAGFPGCLWDGEPSGPFNTSREALRDADEWNPEFDGEEN